MSPPCTRIKDSLEARRARGEISCAECRRHKLRCDKSIPCGTCVRKKCQEICPNGTLMPGTRQYAAGTEVHRQTILQMSNRIRQLEDALQISHSSVSSAAHPLLAEDLLKIKDHTDRPFQSKKITNTFGDDFIDSAGTLATLGRGIESYVGTDPLVIDRIGSPDAIHFNLKLNMPAPVSHLCDTFPFTPAYLPAQGIQTLIMERLPSFERATALVETYLENISWMIRSVDREQIVEELIPEVYRRRDPSGSDPSDQAAPIDPHALSLLLAIFACGAVVDLTLPPWNEEADLYYHLSLSAISLKPVFDGASLNAVQTLGTLGSYDIVCCRKNSLEGAWKMISLCMSLSASIGLHRDPAHFKLSSKIVQRRRRVFWELYSLDMWKSTASGRPPAFTAAVIDCELPEDKEATLSEDGTEIPSVWRFRHRLSKEVMADVIDQLCAARALKYSEILALDQRVRDFGPQHTLDLVINANVPQEDGCTNPLKRTMLVLLKDTILLLLHRSFFVRALIENPMNPMRSRFAPSFLSVFRSAVTLLHFFRESFDRSAQLFGRMWPIYAHMLSATVMLGSIASCGTKSALAPQAYVELNLAIDMLSKMQARSLVQSGLPMILRLRAQAYQALAKHGNAIPPHPPFINQPPELDEEKEFNPLSGFARILRSDYERRRIAIEDHRQLSDFLDESMPSVNASQPINIVTRDSVDFSIPTGSAYSMPSLFDNGAGSGPFASPRKDGSLENDVVNGKSDRILHQAQFPSGRHTPSTSTLRGTPSTDFPAEQAKASLQLDTHSTEGSGVIITGVEGTQGSSSPSITDALNSFGSSLNIAPGSYPPDSRLDIGRAELTSYDLPEQYQFGTPMSCDTLSALSPSALFNMDFDVSFDMRASTGDESVLPLLSDNLEAWRTILNDSRFFSAVDGALDNDN